MFLKVIEWAETSPDAVVWKYPIGKNTIERGSSLTVREGQAAVFCDKGRMADVFGPGMYKLDTDTLPILTRLLSWKYAFEKPFKSEIYFISTRQFTGLKWGTATPVIVRDADYGAVRLRAYGTYSFRVTDPYVFMKELSGARSSFVTQDITDHLRSLIVTMLSDALGESGVPALDLSANLVEVGDSVKNSLDKRLASIGVQLGDFRFESVSLPPELEKALDENARLNMMRGNIDVYTQMAQADAMKEAAKNAGGGVGSMMGAGLGMGMGMHMANAFGTQPKKEARGGARSAPRAGRRSRPTRSSAPNAENRSCGLALRAARRSPRTQNSAPNADRNCNGRLLCVGKSSSLSYLRFCLRSRA